MHDDNPGLQAVRITPGSHANKTLLSGFNARQFNADLWGALDRLYKGLDISDPRSLISANAFPETEEHKRREQEKLTPNVYWVTPDPRSTAVYGMLVEVFGPRPEGERTEVMIEQFIHDLLDDGYNITVIFPVQPIPSPVG